jgi:RHS repeat-associated protein
MPPILPFYYLCHINPQKIMELLRYFYHPDHLGSSSWITDNTGRPIQHLHYLPFGEDWVDQCNSSWNAPYTFSGKEKDVETGYGYFGARYYDSGLSIWLSVDPMSDKYPSMSPYNYCANSPVILVDPDGREFGDYYTLNGLWLGTDGVNDNKAYTATAKNPDGTYSNAKKLPISNSELLDRATWVHGECGGSAELISDRVQNKGDASSTSDARVADYYAFAINNAVKTDGSFDNSVKMRMSKSVNGKTQNTSDGYFSGTGIGGNPNSKNFANARQKGMTNLMNLNGAQTSISAVIKSVTSLNDPTGGARAWLGESYAKTYQQNSNLFTPGAKFQFSFSSGNSKYYHSFFRK